MLGHFSLGRGVSSDLIKALQRFCHSGLYLSLLHSFHRHLLTTHSMPGTVLGSGNTVGDIPGMVLVGSHFIGKDGH